MPASNRFAAKEDEIIMEVANVLYFAVNEYEDHHPPGFINEKVRKRYRHTATVIFVEIFHEVWTGPEGAFSRAFLSTTMRQLVAHTIQEMRAREETHSELDDLRIELKAMLKEKDDQTHSLRADKRATVQVRRELATAQASIRRLETKNRELVEEIECAVDRTAAAEVRAIRAEEDNWRVEYKANEAKNDITHYMLRAMDAEELLKQEREDAKWAHLRAAELKDLFSTVIENQWEAIECMPESLSIPLKPYITLPKADSDPESFVGRTYALRKFSR